MRAIRVRCPAKINTFLSVGPPDATGYHPLRSVFEAVSLFDELDVRETVGVDAFACEDPGVPAENTVTRALRLAREFAEFPRLTITLTKRIPIQSGLGGGSSDSAGLLRVLGSLYASRFTARDLHEIARAVGADVPYFLVGGTARAEGYGEKLTPLDDIAPRTLVIARPQEGVSTPEAFRLLDAGPRPWLPFPDAQGPIYNDFLAVAPRACRDLVATFRQAGANDASLCGSGSAVFGVFTDGEGAERGERVALAFGAAVWVANTLTRAESLQFYRVP